MTTAKGVDGDSEVSANHRSSTTHGRSTGHAHDRSLPFFNYGNEAVQARHQATVRGEQTVHNNEIEAESPFALTKP